ncbi:MAG: hypothetical protein ACRCZF_02210 [Gemmataceae bacterium]
MQTLDDVYSGDTILALIHIPHGVAECRIPRSDLGGRQASYRGQGFKKSDWQKTLNENHLKAAFGVAQSESIVNLGIRRKFEQGVGGLLLYTENQDLKFNWFLVDELRKDAEALSGKALHRRKRLYWVANADGQGLSTWDESGKSSPADAPSPWSELERVHATNTWHLWRSESGDGVFAHGLPNQVGRLRGYGNAIVPKVAAEFIRSLGGTP